MNPFSVGDRVEVRHGYVGNYTWKPGVVTRIGVGGPSPYYYRKEEIVWVRQDGNKHPYQYHDSLIRMAAVDCHLDDPAWPFTWGAVQ